VPRPVPRYESNLDIISTSRVCACSDPKAPDSLFPLAARVFKRTFFSLASDKSNQLSGVITRTIDANLPRAPHRHCSGNLPRALTRICRICTLASYVAHFRPRAHAEFFISCFRQTNSEKRYTSEREYVLSNFFTLPGHGVFSFASRSRAFDAFPSNNGERDLEEIPVRLNLKRRSSRTLSLSHDHNGAR